MRMNASVLSVAVLAAMSLLPSQARAAAGTLATKLSSFEEVPAISSRGTGKFDAELSNDELQIDFHIKWNENLTSGITQSHIHFAQEGVNGGIVVFLCTNLGNGPVGTPTCPTGSADFTGSITAANVIGGAAAQGLDSGQFAKLVRAIKSGIAYVNVHTTSFPGGEIRGQIDYIPSP